MPRQRMKLNKRGKIALTFLLTMVFLLILGLFTNYDKNTAKNRESNVVEAVEKISFTTEPVTPIVESVLGQSIILAENEKRENERVKAFEQQNKIDRKENVVYLTFDDGPTNVTGKLLDILNQYEMTATFFMVGPKIKEHPKIVKRMHKEGFGLALHGMTHDIHQVYRHPFAPSEEMAQAQEILEDITGVRSEVVRMPYGSIPYLTEEMRYVLQTNDFKIWDWNVDSLDWEFSNKQYVYHTIKEIEKVTQLGEAPVVLLHDREETVKHLPKLLTYLEKQGFQTKILTNDMAPYTFVCEGRCYAIN